MRLFLVTNPKKPRVQPAMSELQKWITERAEVIGVDVDGKGELNWTNADAVVVLGGDGTLLATARRLGTRKIPITGVNFGRLGFLASFTPEQFRTHFDSLLAGKLPVSSRAVIEASVVGPEVTCRSTDSDQILSKRSWYSTALNDAVISAGAPFRMIELEIGADDEPGVRYFGDGVIVSTPSGSTAYNVAAGGPIVSPNVEAMCITPLCPHSLSFRPVVMPSSTIIQIIAKKVNSGTTLFCDGQASVKLTAGDRIVVKRAKQEVLLIENPDAREWRTLAEKLNWAVNPSYQK